MNFINTSNGLGGDDYPECDNILLLKVPHHLGDLDFQKSAYEKVPCVNEVIFEINRNQIEMVESLLKNLNLTERIECSFGHERITTY